MSTLKAYHHYRLKDSKKSVHVENIIPVSDIEVSQRMFDEYEDLSTGKESLPAMVEFDCVEEA